MVGFDTCDDAAVYRVSADTALISTVDFITPPVDDPYWFGQISAANSLSDIYAMGGKPLAALNLVMFPAKKLDMVFLKEILRGGYDKVMEAGAAMAGGHSVDDNEPKYGLAVTGVIHPEKIITNCGAKEGDVLILTKPLGTGVLFNACRSRKLPWHELEPILPQVAALNRKAIEIALDFDMNACTDVTGFGIAGHALEIAKGSGLQVNLHFDKLRFYPNIFEMYRKGETTGSNEANRKLVKGSLQIDRDLSREEEEILFEPQTSGGLLLSVAAPQAETLTGLLRDAGIDAAGQVGDVVSSAEPRILVV